jgi:hypothetical protein
MWLWSICKNIFPRYLELHGCVTLPSAVGVEQYNTSMQFKVPRENILLYWPQSHGIYMCLYNICLYNHAFLNFFLATFQSITISIFYDTKVAWLGFPKTYFPQQLPNKIQDIDEPRDLNCIHLSIYAFLSVVLQCWSHCIVFTPQTLLVSQYIVR